MQDDILDYVCKNNSLKKRPKIEVIGSVTEIKKRLRLPAPPCFPERTILFFYFLYIFSILFLFFYFKLY